VDPSTLPSLPVLTEPPRPVRAPTPVEQGRAEPRPRSSLGRSDAVPALPDDEPGLRTAVIRPPRASPTSERPAIPDSDATQPRYDATRAARRSTLEHLDAVTLPTGSPTLPPTPPLPSDSPTVPGRRAPLARMPEPEDDDEPELRTIPLLQQPPAASPRPPAVPPEDDEGPEFLTAPYLRPPSTPSPPMAPEDDDEPELRTMPGLPGPAAASRSFPGPRSDETDEEDLTPAHPQPLSRRHTPVKRVADDSEEATVTVSVGGPASRESSRRGVLVAALLVLLLVGGLAVLVVLRLDGGLVSSRLFPPPPEAALVAPAPQSPPEAQAAPVSPEEPAPAPEATAASPTPEAAAPEPTAAATPEGSAPPDAAAPTEALAAAPLEGNAGTPQAEEPKAEEPAETEPSEPTQPAKRGKVAPSRRTAQRTASSAGTASDEGTAPNVETSPEQVTTADEADRAWQALERERTGTAEPSADKGSLTLVTEPYAKVYLGSRALGETPLFRVPFAPGKYTLRLVAPHFKPLKLQVEIKAGEVTSIRAPLEKLGRE
jgi:hypothetical protein